MNGKQEPGGNTRRRWRVLLVVVMAALAALVVAACGSSGSSSATTNEESPASGNETVAQSSEKCTELGGPTVGIVSLIESSEGAHRSTVAAQEAAEALGFKTIVIDAQGEPAKMAAGVTTLINQNVDAIYLEWIQASAVRPQLERAKEAGIPVFSTLSGATPEQPNDFGPDPQQHARIKAEAVSNLLGGEGQVYGIRWTGTPLNAAWWTGFEEYVQENPKIDLVGEHESDISQLEVDTASTVRQALASNPEIKVFWAEADTQGVAAAKTLKQLGANDVWVVSSLGDKPELELIRAGDKFQTVAVPVEYLGFEAFNWLAETLASGEEAEVPPPAESKLITAKNVPPKGQYWNPPGFQEKFEKEWASEYCNAQ